MKWTPARVGRAAAVVVAGLYGGDAVMPRQGELAPHVLKPAIGRLLGEEVVGIGQPRIGLSAGNGDDILDRQRMAAIDDDGNGVSVGGGHQCAASRNRRS